MDITKIITETQKLLSDNEEWKKRYNKYAVKTLGNIDFIKEQRKKFNEFKPLHLYISLTNAYTSKNSLKLDVRYRGQTVASLTAKNNDVRLSTKNYNNSNSNNFGYESQINNKDWRSKEAQNFRKFFKNRKNTRNNINKKNEEHNIESLLLSQFSKRNRDEKLLTKIQPIKIGGIRFGMPSPLRASISNDIGYSGKQGGGIDILSRTGIGKATYLTVFELKYENKSKESPKNALVQAIKYAVFIRELLRSESGEKWYKIFGFKRKLSEKIKIRVVCAMPDDNPDTSFENEIYEIGNDEIECHYLYFKYDGREVTKFDTSLS